MSKKQYININNTAQETYLASLFQELYFSSKKYNTRRANQKKIIKTSSELTYASKQNLTVRNVELYIKKTKLTLQKAMFIYKFLDIPMETYERIFRKLAAAEIYLYNRYKSDSITEPDLFELFSDKRNMHSLRNNTLLYIYTDIYLGQLAKQQIIQLIPENPKDEFPITRKMHRHFVLHIGLTNTGKTYHALEALKKAKSGAYLSPLRLLALEVQERLLADNVPCSMLTGEEEDIIEGAHHISSTVEKADLTKKYELVVIDECQLIQDESRGAFWTKAILGMQADVLHLCAAPEAEEILKKIITDTSDTYEVIQHTRDTELVFQNKPYSFERVRKGDALVVFSRKSVLNVAQNLSSTGIKASMIYGALPYKTRKEQLKMFLDNKTDVVVATDAIGMGLNLPIKRIVFLENEKFDGTRVRFLLPWEVKQISGRAGRKGMYNKGYVASIDNQDILKEYLDIPNSSISFAYLGFSDVLLDIDSDLIQTLKVWKSIPAGSFYVKQDITRTIKLCEHIGKIYNKFDKKELLKLASIPFDEENEEVLELFNDYVLLYSFGHSLTKPILFGYSLHNLEDHYKCLDLYYSFSKNMGYTPDLIWLREQKLMIADRINKELVTHSSTKKNIQQNNKQNNKQNKRYKYKNVEYIK